MSTTENSGSDSSTLTSDDESGDDKTNCPQPPNIVSKSGVLDLSAVSLGSSLNIFSANLEYQEPSRQIIKREIFAFYKGFTKCHEMRRGGEMLRSQSCCVSMSGEKFFQQTRILTSYLSPLPNPDRWHIWVLCHETPEPFISFMVHGSLTQAFNMRQLHLSHWLLW